MDSKGFINRREFCNLCLKTGLGFVLSPLLFEILKKYAEAREPQSGEKGFIFRKEAMFYEKIDPEWIQCKLCPRKCSLSNGQKGFCRAREPKKGKHYSLVYGNPTAIHIDPIEKKPLFHFLPATGVFSIATAGCNFRCKFCQNWQISQFKPDDTVNFYLPPEHVVRAAKEYNCPTIAYTYTEPSIFYEYMYDTSKIARQHKIKNMYHSNGFLNPQPVKELAKYLDGADIDLKSFSEKFYKDICSGNLKTVLDTLKILRQNNVHLEITNLIVPTLNDRSAEIKQMCLWIKKELGKEIPVHFSRFHPMYLLKNLGSTPVSTLEKAVEIAKGVGLEYVYIGNVPGHPAENTYCPKCSKILIRRTGYFVFEINLAHSKCKYCGYKIYGVWT